MKFKGIGFYKGMGGTGGGSSIEQQLVYLDSEETLYICNHHLLGYCSMPLSQSNASAAVVQLVALNSELLIYK